MRLILPTVNGWITYGGLLLLLAAPAAQTATPPSGSSSPEPAQPEVTYPTFNSPRLDEQLQHYQRYLAEAGPADVLIVGSSRALQGLDPLVLQQALNQKGYTELRVFNIGVNGATAQVVDLLLRRILPPQHLPRLILWADGVRAFNSGRPDRTYQAILTSPGYRQLTIVQPLSAGLRPTQLNGPSSAVASPLDERGFLAVPNRFQPALYYQQYPRVPGQFDGDYQAFRLWGEQTAATTALLRFTRNRRIPIVFVNLPLTQYYLDPTRQRYERQFQRYLRRLSLRGLIVRDFNQPDLAIPDYFQDPSHLNRYGAAAVARQLAQDPKIPWPKVRRSSSAP
ncbi:hypothetical protein [Leptolyngbya sp. FACHB-261]|uniref:hypothetical protein n=1 Tax=Leptolyngbya sp. FACHB-261 TaxID=2692806 RepID=UPI00168244CE|nr:hypothetical protein [Leptolyngbya sp. FACHB-261]MBD2104672.1 hypothetical protein [Leptolyngbya sp. FACHB-261]